jgi:hypothetical protein
LLDNLNIIIKKGKKQVKKTITFKASIKDVTPDIITKLRPEKYKPKAQIKTIAICLRTFVFIIGGDYKINNYLYYKYNMLLNVLQ